MEAAIDESIRRTSELVAARTGGTLILINLREHEVPQGHVGLPLGAAEAIRRLCGSNKAPNQ